MFCSQWPTGQSCAAMLPHVNYSCYFLWSQSSIAGAVQARARRVHAVPSKQSLHHRLSLGLLAFHMLVRGRQVIYAKAAENPTGRCAVVTIDLAARHLSRLSCCRDTKQRMDRVNASLISCLDGFGCMSIFQNWLPGALGEDVVLDHRRFRVIKLVSVVSSCLRSLANLQSVSNFNLPNS